MPLELVTITIKNVWDWSLQVDVFWDSVSSQVSSLLSFSGDSSRSLTGKTVMGNTFGSETCLSGCPLSKYNSYLTIKHIALQLLAPDLSQETN